MGSDVSGTTLRGLLVHDPRITEIWEAQSSYTEADPQPGAVEAQSADTRLVLQPSGTMAAAASLRIQTHEPGHPGPGEGGFIWKEAADSDTEWRGRDVPAIITGWEAVEWVDVGTAVSSTKDPHCVTLSDGTVVVAYEDVAVSNQRLRVATRAPGGSWGGKVTIRSDTTAKDDYLPCLCVLPGDELLLAARYADTSQSEDNIRIWRSTDKGVTWTLISTGALRTAIDNSVGASGYSLRRLRMAHLDGQVLLIVDAISNDTGRTWRDTYLQYASDSLGGRFDFVEAGAASHLFAFGSVLENGTSFLVVYTGNTTANRRYLRVLPDAYTLLSSVADVEANTADVKFGTFDGTTKYLTDGDGAAMVDSTGAIYILTRITQANGNTMNHCDIMRSHDLGETWESMGSQGFGGPTGGGIWYRLDPATVPTSTGTYPKNFTATHSEGRVVVLCNHAASPGTEDDTLNAIYLGGSSQVTMPGIRDSRGNTDRAGWDQTGLPWDLPGNTVWAGSGTPTTEQLSRARLELVCAAAESRRYDLTPTATVAEGMILRHSLQVNSGGDDTTDRINIRATLADASNSYDVAVRFDAAGFTVHDKVSAADVGSPVAITGAIDIIIAIGQAKVATWYRARSQNADREWTTGPAGALSDGGAGTALIRWGVVTTGSSSADVYWYEWHSISAGEVGPGLHDGFTNPDDLMPAYYAGQGRSVWVDGGASVTAVSGPAFVGDLYHFDARSGFPVERVLTAESPTPRVRWRSTNTNQQQIAFELDYGHGIFDASFPGNDTIGVTVLGANFRTGKVEGYLVGTGWVTLSTFDASSGLSWTSGQWLREGGSLSVGGGLGGTGPYFHPGEFEGGYVDMAGTTYRRIKTNTGGIGGAPTYNGKHATIILDGATIGDPASSFTLKVVPKNFTVIVNLLGVEYAGYRLVIDSQSNPDGYFEIGNLIVGWVEYFGHQYSRGRVIETQAGVGASRSLDDVARSRFISPPYRTVEFAWTQGVDTTEVWSDTASPDYVTASTTANAEAVALARSTPLQLAGLLASLHRDGAPKNPAVVYLPSVGRATGGVDDLMLNRRHQFVAGALDPRIRLESILGEENSPTAGEMWRVAQVVIREMV